VILATINLDIKEKWPPGTIARLKDVHMIFALTVLNIKDLLIVNEEFRKVIVVSLIDRWNFITFLVMILLLQVFE